MCLCVCIEHLETDLWFSHPDSPSLCGNKTTVQIDRTPIFALKIPAPKTLEPARSVFKISCLFLRPRPWQFEI